MRGDAGGTALGLLEAAERLADVGLLVSRAGAHGRRADATVGGGTRADNVGVDGARDAVLDLEVELGHDVH